MLLLYGRHTWPFFHSGRRVTSQSTLVWSLIMPHTSLIIVLLTGKVEHFSLSPWRCRTWQRSWTPSPWRSPLGMKSCHSAHTWKRKRHPSSALIHFYSSHFLTAVFKLRPEDGFKLKVLLYVPWASLARHTQTRQRHRDLTWLCRKTLWGCCSRCAIAAGGGKHVECKHESLDKH